MDRKRNRKQGVEPALYTINTSTNGYRNESSSPSTSLVNDASTSIVHGLTRQSVVEPIDLSSGVALVSTPESTNAPLSSSSSSNLALPISCVDFQLLLNTYLNAKQLSWSVQNQSSTVISQAAGSYSNRQTYNETYCLDPGDYTFTINDPGGKGLRAPFGNYTVTVDQEIIKEGGGYFGPVQKTQSTTFTVFPGNSSADDFISSASDESSSSPDDKWIDPNSPISCRFQLILHTDKKGNQTSWNVLSVSRNVTVLSKDFGTYSSYATYNETYCLDEGNYTFTIFDAGNNGLLPPYGNYTIQVAGKQIRQGGGNFDSFKRKQTTPFSILSTNNSSLELGSNTTTTTTTTSTSRPSLSSQMSSSPTNSTVSKPSYPSRSPTILSAPMQLLTNTPTANPTLQPQPSRSPTKIPTVSPSQQPTTSRPTKSPTRKPIQKPSKKPSNAPSLNPTPSPTANPTYSPSKHPSTYPSLAPSRTPSTSMAPSKAPSMSPSLAPSTQPSLNPTIAPTPYSSYFETEVLIILTNVQGAMNETTEMTFRAVTQNFLQSNLPKEGEYVGYSCNITMLDVCSQVTSLSADSNVFVKSYNRSYTIDNIQQRKLTTNGTQNLLVCLRIGGDLHPYNPGAEFIFPEYVLHGFEEDYRGYAIALSASGPTVFSEMKNSPSARIFGGPEWAVPTAILLAAAALLFLACAFCCCFYWKRRRIQHKEGQSEGKGEDPNDDPSEVHPTPRVIMFPTEASSSFQRTELNNREQRESFPIMSNSSRIAPVRSSGMNPFSESFDEESREEVPLVPRNEGASITHESSDDEEEVPLVCGKKDKGESSETSLEDEDEDNKTNTTTSTEGEVKSKNASSSEDEKRSRSTSSQEYEEKADINISHQNKIPGDDENAKEVDHPESSSRSKTSKDSVSHGIESSSAGNESEDEIQRFGVDDDIDDPPQEGRQDDFIVIEKRKLENRSSTRRSRLFKSRLARP